ATLGHAAAQLHMLKVGLNAADLLETENVSKLIKIALPYCANYIDEHGPTGYWYMLEPLESALLKELQRMMLGEQSDKTSIEQAKEILKGVESVNEGKLISSAVRAQTVSNQG
ncbi:MAG: hypothetical protein ABIU05_23255, partial [Nitrospirales bacterium]